MVILFEELSKKEKTSFLKGLENNNQIIKNLFETAYINSEGVCYNIQSSLNNGRVVAKTNLNEFIEIKENQLFKLNTRELYNCISNGKTKISGYSILNNIFTFMTTEGDYIIGEFIDNERLNLVQLESILCNTSVTENINHILSNFEDKMFTEIKVGDYEMMLTHKLFPCIQKCKDIKVSIADNGDGTFYGCFNIGIEETNKSGAITFSIKLNFIYKFLKL